MAARTVTEFDAGKAANSAEGQWSGDEGIRTPDPLDANQVLCRAELHPRVPMLRRVSALGPQTPLGVDHPVGENRCAEPMDRRGGHRIGVLEAIEVVGIQ